MTTQAMSSLGYGICAMVFAVVFFMGIDTVKKLLFQYCRNNNRHGPKSDHTQTNPSK